ncbi:Dynamitin-domain-containing protein [Radiomyces spectabilis]|uniref:Dynamitin-domain-containing protein n=1 Tax=Radiomyces spectabilis TaxID=64574 RepID=UPI00221E4A2F|nr:Dynamitin-domain-containing protein [Radiomyces spectabilis]KAI8379724.1 Dynamitin-domain-containing protein [Radiomyces spectabilis]
MSSKYSALPDIDDQPDVFETPDVPDETHLVSGDDGQQSDDGNENVIRTPVSVKEATQRFKNTVVDADNADFSDKLTRRKKAMYRAYVRRPPGIESNEYEILPKGIALQETKLQKLRRLMYEVQELQQETENEKVLLKNMRVKIMGIR